MYRCVHKITGITVTEKQSECLQAAAVYKALLGGGSASQGRERQPSIAAHSIWMTLYMRQHINSKTSFLKYGKCIEKWQLDYTK